MATAKAVGGRAAATTVGVTTVGAGGMATVGTPKMPVAPINMTPGFAAVTAVSVGEVKIMVALDLSDYSNFVLTKAIKTAKQQNAKMDIVVVVEDSFNQSDSAETEQVYKKRFQDATLTARSYQQNALAQGVKAKVRVLSGKPAAVAIVEYQKSEDLDLIVVGRQSQTFQTTKPIGSVAQSVVTHATCTVMVVRCMKKKDFID